MLNVSLNSGGTIIVESDTYWNCKAIGNFTLSKYSGNKNAEIEINIPNEIAVAGGTVLFSSGKEKCDNKELTIFLNNNCYISTTPNYVYCGNKKYIYFYYKSQYETFNVTVNCFDGWSVSNVTNLNYIKDGNNLIIISNPIDYNKPTEEGQLVIIPAHNVNCSNKIFVKLIRENN